MLLTAEQILASEDMPRGEEVPVPEWGGEVFVIAMTGAEFDEYEQASMVDDGNGNKVFDYVNVRARLLAFTIRDSERRRTFTTAQVELLGKKNAVPIKRVFDVAARLNGMTKDLSDRVKN